MDIYKPQKFFEDFPTLPKSTRPKSVATPEYNCIAWALGQNNRSWWPRSPYHYWPSMCTNEVTISAFEEVFALFGYKPCNNSNQEKGLEKIALYVLSGLPTHATRQIANGRWTSKCGLNVDIEHKIEQLEGPRYGRIFKFFCRPIPSK